MLYILKKKSRCTTCTVFVDHSLIELRGKKDQKRGHSNEEISENHFLPELAAAASRPGLEGLLIPTQSTLPLHCLAPSLGTRNIATGTDWFEAINISLQKGRSSLISVINISCEVSLSCSRGKEGAGMGKVVEMTLGTDSEILSWRAKPVCQRLL